MGEVFGEVVRVVASVAGILILIWAVVIALTIPVRHIGLAACCVEYERERLRTNYQSPPCPCGEEQKRQAPSGRFRSLFFK